MWAYCQKFALVSINCQQIAKLLNGTDLYYNFLLLRGSQLWMKSFLLCKASCFGLLLYSFSVIPQLFVNIYVYKTKHYQSPDHNRMHMGSLKWYCACCIASGIKQKCSLCFLILTKTKITSSIS